MLAFAVQCTSGVALNISIKYERNSIRVLKTNDLARTIEFTEAEDMGKPLSLEDLANYAEL